MDVLDCRLGGWHAARIVGVKYRTLDRWIRTGLLPRPAIPAEGKGTRRGFSFLDLVRARAVAHLRRQGISLQNVRKVVAELAHYGFDDPLIQTGQLVVAGERLFWVLDDMALLDVLRDQLAARPLVILPVAEIVANTKMKVAAIAAA